ncbi:putative short chain dehydrogenase/reductase [Mytilinidion resinicola]|uniref:Short chain dehydrogenase/reductase n=1 Tax=Mytilinidion resinicola TaxID=574789 RepID=A0A6A6YCI8_9PEZI|nr:putative short chain dehydrogenase/reductase [Mytilinidion resinicola]KAF2805815.1 putative short chain dehydrogenase/reductase [Mytilinidion resinicola]
MRLYNPFSTLPSYNPLTLLSAGGFTTHHNSKHADTPHLSGEVAVITGGQSGIGREITAQLLLHGISKVYIIARSAAKYQDAMSEWVNKKGLKRSDVESRTEFIPCDLSSVKDVARASNELLSKLDRLDILLNNAAVPPTPDYSLSPDGTETVFAIIHVGHFTLTNILLPLIERTAATFGGARVVDTNSSLHMACQELDLSLLTSPKPTKSPVLFDAVWRYARAKLAGIMFTRELAKRLQKKGVTNVYVNSFFPGNIPTDAFDTWKLFFGNFVGSAFKPVFSIMGQTVEEGAATALFLATNRDVELKDIKGKYFVPIATESKPSTLAENKDLQKNLWYWTDHQVTEVLGKGWQDVGESTVKRPIGHG